VIKKITFVLFVFFATVVMIYVFKLFDEDKKEAKNTFENNDQSIYQNESDDAILELPDHSEYLKQINESVKTARDNQEKAKQLTETKEYKLQTKLLLEVIRNRTQKLRESSPELKLHGRIIDQFGNGVSGAEFNYGANRTYLYQATGSGKAITDTQGYFYIDKVKGER